MIEFPNEPALIPYITAGYPSIDSLETTINSLERGGADIVELGLPFSEPIADGPTIQKAIARSLSNGMTSDIFFRKLKNMDLDIPLVVMTYYNLIFHRGLEKFVKDCDKSGIEGIIVPDLPVEEANKLKNVCDSFNIDLIFIVSPTTTGSRFKKIKKKCSGFLYIQARLGTTGARENLSNTIFTSLKRFNTKTPKAVGFGISKEQHATDVIKAGADGVVAGSIFIDLIESDIRETKKEYKNIKQDKTNIGQKQKQNNKSKNQQQSWPNKIEDKAKELKKGALKGRDRN